MAMGLLLLRSLYFMLPAYLANGAPVATQNIFKSLAVPVDLGAHFRGRPFFGSHKTFRGVIAAVVAGIVVFLVQVYLYRFPFFQNWSFFDYKEMYLSYSVLPGFLLGLGAITGDLVKSFFKRQFDVKPGSRWIPWDQIDFLLGALAFISIIYLLQWQAVVALLVFTPPIHMAANHLGYYLKIRKVKW